MNELDLLNRAKDITAFTLLGVAVVAGHRGWLVNRWVYDAREVAHQAALTEQREETQKAIASAERWERIALKALGVAENIAGK